MRTQKISAVQPDIQRNSVFTYYVLLGQRLIATNYLVVIDNDKYTGCLNS